MTETNYDIVTIGSGHNGLVAAAYLAAAGRKVLVVERQPWFGGGVITRELTVPGFKHDQHSMISGTMSTSSSADLFEQLDADSDHDQLDHEHITKIFASELMLVSPVRRPTFSAP